MPEKRSDFYKSLNQMREENSSLGNPLVNTVDDSTSVGEEISAYAYLKTPIYRGFDILNEQHQAMLDEGEALQKYKESRNWWQRAMDTLQDIGNNIAEGVLNFVDGIFDTVAYTIGLMGDDSFKEDIKNVMNYDWQAQVLNVGQQLNFNGALLTGDLFTADYWNKWGDTGSAEASRYNLNKTGASSFQSDIGDGGQTIKAVEQGIGYVLPSVVVGIATGGSSVAGMAMLGATGVSAFGSGTNQALNDGADYYKAGQSGLVTAGIEMGTEALSWGVGKVAGKIASKFGKSVTYGTRIGAGSFGKGISKLTAKELGKAALEEGTEEFISELLSPLAKEVYQEGAFQKAWTFGSEENKEMWQSAAVSGIAGAVGGAFGASVQGAFIQTKLSSTGIDLANKYGEIVDLHDRAIKEAQKGSKANQDLISQYETQIGELTKEWEVDMEEFKKSNPEKFKNLMEMIKDPKAYVTQLKKENADLDETKISEFKNSYLENYKDITANLNQDTYSKIAELNSSKESTVKMGEASNFDTKNFTKEFLKENGIVEGEDIKAYYDPATKTTLINPKYKAEFYELMAHESISHGILDTNETLRDQLIANIEKNDGLNELFHKNDAQIEKLYGSQGEGVMQSERLASFLENFIKNQKSYDRVLNIKQGNKLLNLLNKIKNSVTLTKDSKFLKQLEKTIEKVKKTVAPKTSTYKPRLAFSKTYNEEDKATGEKVHADIIKNAAQAFQDRFITLNKVEDIYNTMLSSTKEMFKLNDIKLSASKYKFARKTFVDFNELLNKPEQLQTELTNVIDTFLDSEVVLSDEYLVGDESLPLTRTTKTTLKEIIELSGMDVEEFRRESVIQLAEALKEKSQATKLFKLKEFYNTYIQELRDQISYYKQVAGDVIKAKTIWDRGKNLLMENKARATKVGDQYVAKLEFYKNIFKGDFGYSKTYQNISPNTVTRIVNAMDAYTKENIEALGGAWFTREEKGEMSNEAIKDNVTLLRSKFKDGKFPNRSLTVEELTAVRNVLQGINAEMNDLVSKEGIARHQAMFKGDLELRVIDLSAYKEKFKKLGIVERELNYTSSMDTVLANLFGADSSIHHILYDNIFEALDRKYLQEGRMRNELIDLLKKYKLWSKTSSSPNKTFTTKVDFAGKKIPKGILMDIYAETLTAKGLATLQKGGYTYKVNDRSVREHLVLNGELIMQLDEILSDDERAFVNELVTEQYNGTWKRYKSDSDVKIRNFTDVLEGEVYYPTNKSDTNGTSLDQGNFQNLDLSDQSFNKRRNAHTEHLSLLGMDIVERARSYIDGLTKYGEMTQELKLFDSLMKQWTTDKNGNRMSRDSLFQKNIAPWTEYKNYLIGQILGTNKGVMQGKAFGNLVAATLYGNPSVVLKQTASLPTIMLEVSPKAWAKSLFKGWKNLGQYKETKAFIESQSGIASQRWLDFDSVAANTLQQDVGKIGKFFGIPMEKMDEGVIVLFGWQAAQEEARIRTGFEIGSAENQAEAIKILNKIIANTQSNSISINTSMARSGNAGYIRKVLSYFSSDLQNKISRLNRIINEAKYAKQRLAGIEAMELTAQSEYDTAKEVLETFKVERVGTINFEEEVERLQREVDSKKDTLDTIKEMKNSELKILNGGDRAKEALKYAIAVLLSTFMVAGIDQLIQRLYGRKGWTEDTIDDFFKDLLLEGTIGNLPYGSNIANAVEYNQDVGGYDFTLINSAIDIIKDVKSMIEKGEFNPSSLVDLFTTIGQLSGIPMKNIYNLVMGIWKNVDGSGYQTEALIKGYSDTYIRKAYKEQLDKGQMKQANAYLELLMKNYKVGNNDGEVNTELNRLMQQGYYALPKNMMTSYEVEEDVEKKLTDSQKTEFVNYYGLATEEVKKLINDSSYKSLDDEYKAKTIKKIYDTYYEYAKIKVVGGSTNNKVLNVMLKTGNGIKMSRYLGVLSSLNNIEATKDKSRKELVLAQINKLKGYSKAEKLLIAWLCGYSLTNENKVMLGNYLIRSGGAKKDIKELLK